MKSTLKRWLPFVAAAGALIALISALVIAPQRQTMLTESAETRAHATATLARIAAVQPTSIEDAAFRDALAKAGEDPSIAVVWLFTPEGKILQGNLAFSEGKVAEQATDETRRVLSALPEETLDAAQRTALLAVSVMQAEGEHNDVFRHRLEPVYDAEGTIVALVGLTYNASSAMGQPGTSWMIALLGGLLGWAVYWLALPVWVWLDARARGERAWVWASFVLLGNLVALMAYILARVPRSQTASA